AEIERWPETALTRELARHPAFVNRDVFPIIRRPPDAKAEIERWPETALTRELARHPAFVNRDVFPIIRRP
ncbi:hypothetical protein C7D72_30030, partial [Klebsiella pneumoniae]